MSKLGPAVGLRPTTLTPDEMRAARAERHLLWRIEIERKLAWREGFKAGAAIAVILLLAGVGAVWSLLEALR